MNDDDNSGAIIAGAAALGTAAINFGSETYRNTKQMELARYGYEQQRQMIAEQNKYNSPIEQLKRYEEAGLNPNLIYSEGKASAGNQSDIARYTAPSLDAPQLDLNSAIQMALAFKQINADINVKNEQAYSQRQLGLMYQQDYYSKLIDNAFKAEITGFNPGLLMSNDDIQMIREGKKFQAYDLDISAKKASVNYTEALTQYNKLNQREKAFILDNLQPLQLEYQRLLNEGRTTDNALKQIRLDLNDSLKSIGGERGANLIWNVLRSLLSLSLVR